jgi:hypothetical protein
LMSKNRTNCICTAMIYDPLDPANKEKGILRRNLSNTSLYQNVRKLVRNILKKNEDLYVVNEKKKS